MMLVKDQVTMAPECEPLPPRLSESPIKLPGHDTIETYHWPVYPELDDVPLNTSKISGAETASCSAINPGVGVLLAPDIEGTLAC